MRAFWNMAPCSLIDRRFRDEYCLHFQGDGHTYETSVFFYGTIWCLIKEGCQIQEYSLTLIHSLVAESILIRVTDVVYSDSW
jgi:hypothetical protein